MHNIFPVLMVCFPPSLLSPWHCTTGFGKPSGSRGHFWLLVFFDLLCLYSVLFTCMFPLLPSLCNFCVYCPSLSLVFVYAGFPRPYKDPRKCTHYLKDCSLCAKCHIKLLVFVCLTTKRRKYASTCRNRLPVKEINSARLWLWYRLWVWIQALMQYLLFRKLIHHFCKITTSIIRWTFASEDLFCLLVGCIIGAFIALIEELLSVVCSSASYVSSLWNIKA